MFLDAIQQSPGLRTLAPPFPQQTHPDADAGAAENNALIPSWGRYYRARRRASEHLIHGLTHKPSSSRAGVLLTDFAIGAAIGAVAAVAAVAVIACAIAVAAGLTLDVVSGVVIDAAIRVAVVCMRGGARLAASFVASLLAGAARVRKGECCDQNFCVPYPYYLVPRSCGLVANDYYSDEEFVVWQCMPRAGRSKPQSTPPAPWSSPPPPGARRRGGASRRGTSSGARRRGSRAPG